MSDVLLKQAKTFSEIGDPISDTHPSFSKNAKDMVARSKEYDRLQLEKWVRLEVAEQLESRLNRAQQLAKKFPDEGYDLVDLLDKQRKWLEKLLGVLSDGSTSMSAKTTINSSDDCFRGVRYQSMSSLADSRLSLPRSAQVSVSTVFPPSCPEHGAMNKVSKNGMWRCLECHGGYNENTKKYLKDSSEGFICEGQPKTEESK